MSETEHKRTREERVSEARRYMRETDPDGSYYNFEECESCKFHDHNGDCQKNELYQCKSMPPCYYYEKK